MALTMQQWLSHKAHRELVAADQGQWVGLLDENAEPLFDCPAPIDINAPETRGAPVSGDAQFEISDEKGLLHPIVDELVSDSWGRADAEGHLIPSMGPTRYLVVERGSRRWTYRVTHSKLSALDGDRPAALGVYGEDLLSKLNRIPMFSAPTTITGEFTRFDRDWVGDQSTAKLFSQPRDLQDLKMLTVADGATLDGPAEQVIRDAIAGSVAAAFKAVGKPQTILVSTASSGISSPYLALTMNDSYLWDGLGALALQANVQVDVFLWLPGDGPVDGVPELEGLTQPRTIVTVKQGMEVAGG